MDANGHPINGHSRIPTKEELRDLRRQQTLQERKIAIARGKIQLAQLERHKKLQESAEAWDYFSPLQAITDRMREVDGFAYPISTAQDRAYGANWPFWRTWQEHARLRAASRVLCGISSNARGMLNGLTSYVVGNGYSYRVMGVDDDAPEELIKFVQDRIIDKFLELNRWNTLERELFQRDRRDGEFFLEYFPEDDGLTHAYPAEPEWVVEGYGPIETSSFGCINEPGNLYDITAYFKSPGGSTAGGKVVRSLQSLRKKRKREQWDGDTVMDHCKTDNFDRVVKRGCPDFAFEACDAIRTAGRAITNMGEATAIQAAIVGIRQHEVATPEQVQEFADSNSDYETNVPFGTRRRGTQYFQSGTFLDIDKGQEYIAPPFAANVDKFVQAIQAMLRSAAVRWNAPEWLISADSSNNAYASSLVAESPFVRNCESAQVSYKWHFEQAIWVAIRNWCRTFDGVKVGGVRYTFAQLRRLLKVEATPPQIEARDSGKIASENQTYVTLGVKSRQKCAEELNLDWEQMARDNEEYQERFGDQGADGQPGTDDDPLAALMQQAGGGDEEEGEEDQPAEGEDDAGGEEDEGEQDVDSLIAELERESGEDTSESRLLRESAKSDIRKLVALAKEAYQRKTDGEDGSPDYGQLYFNEADGKAWYVTADGDSREFTRWLFPKLEAVIGKGNLRMEAESFPDGDGWIQLYPKKTDASESRSLREDLRAFASVTGLPVKTSRRLLREYVEQNDAAGLDDDLSLAADVLGMDAGQARAAFAAWIGGDDA